jgi:hypothetical protein
VDEKLLGHAWQTEGLVLELDPAALALSPDEPAVSAVFGVAGADEERRSSTALFRVGERQLGELLRFDEHDSGAGSPRERVRARVRAEAAGGRTLPDLVLETETETCAGSDAEPRCQMRTGTRVYRWAGSGYAEAASPAAPAAGP